MGNGDTSETDTVTAHPLSDSVTEYHYSDSITAHPHNNLWVIILVNIHRFTLDHSQHPQFTFYKPYSSIRTVFSKDSITLRK